MRAVSRCLDWSGLDMMTATWCVSSPCGQKFGPSCYDYHAHYTKHSKELPLAASQHCSPLLALPTHVRLEVFIHPLRKVLTQHAVQCDTTTTLCSAS